MSNMSCEFVFENNKWFVYVFETGDKIEFEEGIIFKTGSAGRNNLFGTVCSLQGVAQLDMSPKTRFALRIGSPRIGGGPLWHLTTDGRCVRYHQNQSRNHA